MFFKQEVIIMTTFDKILADGIITIIRGLDSDHAEKTVAVSYTHLTLPTT